MSFRATLAALGVKDEDGDRLCAALGVCCKRTAVEDGGEEPLRHFAPPAGSAEALLQALRRFVAARHALIEGIESQLMRLDTQWYAATGSKTVAAATMITGVSLLFIPFTTVSGAITLISGAGLAAASVGGERLAEQINGSEVRGFVDEDQSAERSFEEHLRLTLELGSWTEALISWSMEAGLLVQEGPQPGQSGRCLLRPLSDLSYGSRGGAVLGLTKASACRVNQRLRESLAALQKLQERLQAEASPRTASTNNDSGPVIAPAAVRSLHFSQGPGSFGGLASREAEASLEGASLETALDELLARRKRLADWLDRYLEHFDVALGSMVGSTALATATTITGALLFFFPFTSLAGAITLASGTSLGAGAWGSEALAEQLTKERLQSLVDADDAAHEALGREVPLVLQGRRAPNGADFDPAEPEHVQAVRAVEEWVRQWLSEPTVPVEEPEAVEVSGLVPRMLSLQTKAATRRLRNAVLASLADLHRLKALLSSSPTVAPNAALPDVDLAGGVLPALEASLADLVGKRQQLLTRLESLLEACKLKRDVANSSKTVAALATVTGAVLFFIPATSLAGLIVIVSASGVGAVAAGGEATANHATMRQLQRCADEDRSAEAQFDRCLRAALHGAGAGPLPSKVAALLGSWLGGDSATFGSQPSLQSEAVRSLRMIWTPLDCAYSWVTSSYTSKSVEQVYQDVRRTQERLLCLQRCLERGPESLPRSPPVSGTMEACTAADLAELAEGKMQEPETAAAEQTAADNTNVVAFLDGLIEERALVLGEEEQQPTDSLVEALTVLMAKRQQLVDWMDRFLEGHDASKLAIGGSQLLSVVGNITGVVLLFIPATSIAGGVVLASMYGVDFGVGTNKTLMQRSKESNLSRCVAEDQAAQQAFDRRLLAVLRGEEWPSGEAADAPTDEASEARRCEARAAVEAWVKARSALAHGRGPRGGLGAGSGAALPLQARDTARQFREDLRALLGDLRNLRGRL